MQNVKQTKLQTELHSKRQPASPEQIRAQQKRDAEKDRAAVQANLPTVAKPTAMAAADGKSTVDRILDEYAQDYLPTGLFNGKEGFFFLHGTDTRLSPDTRYVAHAGGTRLDRVKFNGPGEQPTRVGGPLYGEGFELPPRESLGDNDPTKWPISELSGKPEDPWKLQFVLPLENVETGDAIAFATMSPTGRNAVGKFLRAFNRMRSLHPDELPIIQLRPSSYIHKKFGKVNIPALIIVGRAKADGMQTPNTPPQAMTLGEDMDDSLDF